MQQHPYPFGLLLLFFPLYPPHPEGESCLPYPLPQRGGNFPLRGKGGQLSPSGWVRRGKVCCLWILSPNLWIIGEGGGGLLEGHVVLFNLKIRHINRKIILSIVLFLQKISNDIYKYLNSTSGNSPTFTSESNFFSINNKNICYYIYLFWSIIFKCFKYSVNWIRNRYI